jgi:hypothetical protein
MTTAELCASADGAPAEARCRSGGPLNSMVFFLACIALLLASTAAFAQSQQVERIHIDDFVLQTRIGETSYASYTLEDSFELVPGEWVFEIWQGNRKLATQSFKVERMSNDCDSCEGF